MKISVYFLLFIASILLLCIVFDPLFEILLKVLETITDIMQIISS